MVHEPFTDLSLSFIYRWLTRGALLEELEAAGAYAGGSTSAGMDDGPAFGETIGLVEVSLGVTIIVMGLGNNDRVRVRQVGGERFLCWFDCGAAGHNSRSAGQDCGESRLVITRAATDAAPRGSLHTSVAALIRDGHYR